MIHIDFQAGAHGNFLEFVCNIMAGVKTEGTPFNAAGAAHRKRYLSKKVFHQGHYSWGNGELVYDRVVTIHINIDDLLPLSQVSFLRAADYGHDNNKLEIDTYNKLNSSYPWILERILHSFFVNQIENSYNAVKDPSWPEVRTIKDFENLPEHIRKECMEVHHLELLELNAQHPNCPRYILREFFQIGFEEPTNHGFITQQNLVNYNDNMDVYVFPFDAFYNTEKFMDQIESIASWAGFTYNTQEQILDLHKAFLQRQPYKDSKSKCDRIVQQLMANQIQPPELNLMEEAYVNAMLRKNGYECRY